MADDAVDENRQFDQVLMRLDALMKHSQGGDAGEEKEAATMHHDVPVLTEVYAGESSAPATLEQDAPPVLTDTAPGQMRLAEAYVQLADMAAVARHEQQVEALLTQLMPEMREMIGRIVREEFDQLQQTLAGRVEIEAEHLLRQRLLNEITLK